MKSTKFIGVMVLSILLAIFLTACGGGDGGGTTTTTQKLSGTAAKGAAMVNVTVTVKDKNGSEKTGTTGSDGKYEVDVTGMTAPFLLRVSTGTGYLYSVATATGTSNIHPFTDLIIRNWYKVKGVDVETDFSGTGALSQIPTASEIDTIEAVVRNILSTWLSNVGLNAPTFNLITSTFNADSTGFDKVLDNTSVVIDMTGNVTVTTADPNTGIESTAVTTTISTNLTAADTTKPSDPAGLIVIPASTTAIVLVCNASTDNVGVAGYNIYRGGSKIATSPFPVYSDTGLTSNTQYCYKVEAFDGAGNVSQNKSAQECATILTGTDSTAPSVPTNLTATVASSSQINLSWTMPASTTSVMGYAIYRDGIKIASVSGGSWSYSDTGLTPGTQYCYTLRSFDAAMNYSADSTQVCATPLSTSTPTLNDFAGTWQGNVSGAVYHPDYVESSFFTATVNLSVSGSQLSGTLVIDEPPTLNIAGTVTNGTFTFSIPCSDPTNPDCREWNVTAKATLVTNLTTMNVIGSGTFCGADGGDPGNFYATLTKQ